MKHITNPNITTWKGKYIILYKANSSKIKVKTELFPKDSVPEVYTKKLGKSPRFLTITHMPLFAKWFRCYGILTIHVTTEFCFWTELRWNGSSVSSPRLAETLEIANTILVGNSLSFPMVYYTALNN
jgi:hypothetical protein